MNWLCVRATNSLMSIRESVSKFFAKLASFGPSWRWTWLHVERLSWISGTLFGGGSFLLAGIAVWLVFYPPKPAKTPYGVDNSNASLAAPSASASAPTATAVQPPTDLSEAAGSQGQQVTASAPEPPRMSIAALNLNVQKSDFQEYAFEEGGKTLRAFRVTEIGDERWDCVMSARSQAMRKKCGDTSKLAVVFDVTLLMNHGDPVVLKEIRAQVLEGSGRFSGSAGDLFTSAIPSSASYSLKLPDPDRAPLPRFNRVAAIPPLLVRPGQPARFDIALRHQCDISCQYYLRLKFLMSSGETVESERLYVAW